jgi:hypothetical protein
MMVSVERRFPVYASFPISGGSMNSNIKEIYLVVCLAFCCELEFWVYCVKSSNMFCMSVWVVS